MTATLSQAMDPEQDWRDEVRANFRDLNQAIKNLEKRTSDLDTTITMRGGGVLDRLSATEGKAVEAASEAKEAKHEVATIKAKVAFAAACVSALVAAVWAVATKIWNPHN